MLSAEKRGTHEKATQPRSGVNYPTPMLRPPFSVAINRAAESAVLIHRRGDIMSKVWFSVVLGAAALVGLPGISAAQHGGMHGQMHGSMHSQMRSGMHSQMRGSMHSQMRSGM